MADRVELECHCCATKLVVDTTSGEILSQERPPADHAQTFDTAMDQVRGGEKRRVDAFDKAFERTKNLDEVLGKKFEEAVETILRTLGCEILETRVKDEASHEEIDLVAVTPGGKRIWVECKGSWNPAKRSEGLRRSDTSKKAVATAWHLKAVHGEQMPAYVLVTSHLPVSGNYSDHLLSAALASGLFESVVQYTKLDEWVERFDAGGSENSVTPAEQDDDS